MIYSIVLPRRYSHDEQQWQQLDEMVAEAERYWEELHEGVRDYDLAKARYIFG